MFVDGSLSRKTCVQFIENDECMVDDAVEHVLETHELRNSYGHIRN